MLKFTYLLPQWEYGDVKSNSSTNLECIYTYIYIYIYIYRNNVHLLCSRIETSNFLVHIRTQHGVVSWLWSLVFINCPRLSIVLCSCQLQWFLCSSNMITRLVVHSVLVCLLMMFQVKTQQRMESKDEREWQKILKFPVTYFTVPAGIWLQCVS